MRYFIFVSVLLATGCGTACLKVGTTRCNGQVLETCGTSKIWQRALDCTQVTPLRPGAPMDWTCGKVEKGYGCIPGGAT